MTQRDKSVFPYTIMSLRTRLVIFITVSQGHSTVSGTKCSFEQTNERRKKRLNDTEAAQNGGTTICWESKLGVTLAMGLEVSYFASLGPMYHI